MEHLTGNQKLLFDRYDRDRVSAQERLEGRSREWRGRFSRIEEELEELETLKDWKVGIEGQLRLLQAIIGLIALLPILASIWQALQN